MESINISQNVRETDSKDLSYKELITRERVENTPFDVIEITETGTIFGVMGKYRITEKEYKTKKECEEELKEITWDRVVQVILLLNEEYIANGLITK